MPTLVTPTFTDDIAINIDALFKHLTKEDFFEMCRQNPDLRIEMSKRGDITIISPLGGEASGRNFELILDFAIWVEKTGTGKGFESKAMFVLPNGASRSPYLSWIKWERWHQLTPEQRKSFPPICPDFVVELRSPSDRLKDVQAKMEEYMECGAQLGWLIDPQQKKVFVYRSDQGADQPVEELDNPASVSGEPLLKGFVLQLKEYFSE